MELQLRDVLSILLQQEEKLDREYIPDALAVPLQGNLLLSPRCPKLSVMEPLQRERDTEVLRRMTPGQKLAVLRGLIRQAWDLKAAAVRARRPDLSEPEVRARARELVGGDGP